MNGGGVGGDGGCDRGGGDIDGHVPGNRYHIREHAKNT